MTRLEQAGTKKTEEEEEAKDRLKKEKHRPRHYVKPAPTVEDDDLDKALADAASKAAAVQAIPVVAAVTAADVLNRDRVVAETDTTAERGCNDKRKEAKEESANEAVDDRDIDEWLDEEWEAEAEQKWEKILERKYEETGWTQVPTSGVRRGVDVVDGESMCPFGGNPFDHAVEKGKRINNYEHYVVASSMPYKTAGDNCYMAKKPEEAKVRWQAGLNMIRSVFCPSDETIELLCTLRNSIALLAVEEKEWDKVLEYTKETLLLNPSNVHALYVRAQAFAAKDSWALAAQSLRTLIEHRPDNKEAAEFLSFVEGNIRSDAQ